MFLAMVYMGVDFSCSVCQKALWIIRTSPVSHPTFKMENIMNIQTTKLRVIAPLLGVALALGYAAADASTYEFNTLDAPFATRNSAALDVNNNGVIVGTVDDSTSGYIYSSGGFTALKYPGSIQFQPESINDSNQTVGTTNFDGASQNGFIYNGSTYTLFNVPGMYGTGLLGNNNHGDLVGYVQALFGSPTLAYSRIGGVDSTFLPVGGVASAFTAINDAGVMTGYFIDAGGTYRSMIYIGGAMVELVIPGSVFSMAADINNLGQVVGTFLDGAGVQHGFLYTGGNYTVLDFPGSNNSYASGINDQGVIVGGWNSGSEWRGYVANAVPTPPTLPLMVLGLGLLGIISQRSSNGVKRSPKAMADESTD